MGPPCYIQSVVSFILCKVTWVISVSLNVIPSGLFINMMHPGRSLTTIVKWGRKNPTTMCLFSDKCCRNPDKGCPHRALAALLAGGSRNLQFFVCMQHQVWVCKEDSVGAFILQSLWLQVNNGLKTLSVVNREDTKTNAGWNAGIKIKIYHNWSLIM